MPTYEYQCKSCKHTFDAFQSMKDDPLKVCPECGKEIRRLINGGTGIIFKGGGFYATDKGGKSAIINKSEKISAETAAAKPAEACPGCPSADSCPKAANS